MLDLFDRLATRPAGALAGWRDDAPVTHGEFAARAGAWAAFGARSQAAQVALFIEDSLEFGAALIGAWTSRKTVWLVADTLPASCAALAGRVDAFWGEFPAPYAPGVPLPADMTSGCASAPADDFPALVVYTSGSTGAPTPISKRLAQLTGEVAALEAQFGAALGTAGVVATVSHQHIYGLLFRILWPLAAGRAIHATRHEFPETLTPALATRDCILVASPAHLKRMPDHLDWRGAARMLRAVFSSGGMLERDASEHAASLLGQAPIEVYGSSESGGVAWRRRDAGEEWTPLPGVRWRLDGAGALEVGSPFAGPQGWLALADRVEDRGAGRFVLRGRADRIVKIEEKRVSLDAIEAALTNTGLVREARVLCAPDTVRQSLAAFVLPSEEGRALLAQGGKAALNAALRAALTPLLESVALPRRWRYLDAWPVNAQGKTPQSHLLALLDEAPKERPRFPALRVLDANATRALL